jgi:hypothetical protein
MIYAPYGRFFENEKPLKWSSENVDKARNSEWAKTTRLQMLNGEKPSACQLCWSEEELGLNSKRQHMLQIYDVDEMIENTKSDGSIDLDKIKLTYLDLRLGNLCNLACRSCSPTDSSLWLNDFATLTQVDDKTKFSYLGGSEYDVIKKNGIWKIDSNDFEWFSEPEFDIWIENQIKTNVDKIYFTGGEPTINKKHMQILDKIIESGRAPEMSLEYNSNFVAIPNRLLEQWTHFKTVFVGISVDAIGPLATYIRYPSDWNDIEQNVSKVAYNQIPQLHATFVTTISILNIRHFLYLTEWLLDTQYQNINKIPSYHILHNPISYCLQVLPLDIKNQIKKEYEDFFQRARWKYGPDVGDRLTEYYAAIISYMFAEDKSKLLTATKKQTLKLDLIRGQSLAKYLPWLDDCLNNLQNS